MLSAANRDLIPEGTVLLEPPAMDTALLGWAEVDGVIRAVYSYRGLIRYFVEEFKEDPEPEQAAEEWIDFNVMGLRLSTEDGLPSHPVIVVDLSV